MSRLKINIPVVFVCSLIAFLLLSCGKEKSIAVTSVSIGQTTAEMLIGETAQLNAMVLPGDATDRTVFWASSKQSVATVSSAGLVTAVGEGTATITASAGGHLATCLVMVSKRVVPVVSVELNKVSLDLIKGMSEVLVATVKPDDATDKTVIWYSSNATVASVDKNGKVAAVTGGEVTISAKCGNREARCMVTVVVPISSLNLNKESISLTEGESETLAVSILPEDATVQNLKWHSSNEQIVRVDDEGKVTAIKKGEATITVEVGDKSASCRVVVDEPFVPVNGVSLSMSSLKLMKGGSETLVATVSPSNASKPTVVWKSSDESIVKVDQDGKVTAIKIGSATITATAGECFASCMVSVTIPVSGVTLSSSFLTLGKGETFVLVANVSPEDAMDKTIIWSSSNNSVATVKDGTVLGVGGGTAEITATTRDGGYAAKCVVKVQVPVQGVSLSETSLSIYQFEDAILTASVIPSDATNKAVSWSSDNPDVVSVNASGRVTGRAGGNAVITVMTADGDFSAQCSVTVIADGHEAVNLGLSVKWATMNFDASIETETGGYYMWGDPSGTAFVPYYSAPDVSSISGTQYDIVRKNWGGSWRIPTSSELSELHSRCTWKEETINGVSVFRVTGPNGNSIIVPPTGYAFPSDGPIGSISIMSEESAYQMSGSSYTDGNWRFTYIYYYDPRGSHGVDYYNVDFIRVPIRPVRP